MSDSTQPSHHADDARADAAPPTDAVTDDVRADAAPIDDDARTEVPDTDDSE